jgi:peptidoglycan/LPS O-acetylase OafA/YrhL
MAVVLGCLQVASSWFRGTHGGRYYYTADPADPSTWRGDHFNMTPRRRMFEAFHKNVGYFAGFFAVGAVASGLMQFPMPALTVVMLGTVFAIIALCIALEHKGRRYDTYRSVFGNNPDHPYNKARKDL